MNTTQSGSGRVDDIKSGPKREIRGATKLVKPEMRHKLAQLPFEQKIRKVGELIQLRQKIKTDASISEHERANGARLGRQSTGLPAGRALREINARQDVRKYAAKQGISEEAALEKGMAESSRVHRSGSRDYFEGVI